MSFWNKNIKQKLKNAAVIVAHPDDETLWCGGMILNGSDYNWEIITICRKNDPDRAPRFFQALKCYQAIGKMGDLDDGPEQKPLNVKQLKNTILALLSRREYDLVLTHSINGEYTKHLRHEEVGRAVQALWNEKELQIGKLWMFAYEDGNKKYLPRAIRDADHLDLLDKYTWDEKYRIITGVYNFLPESFEGKVTPRVEAFWRFNEPSKIKKLMKRRIK
ncbi:PIG-L family deacetylase [Candidatus Margulisiibacteriota bacterium]